MPTPEKPNPPTSPKAPEEMREADTANGESDALDDPPSGDADDRRHD